MSTLQIDIRSSHHWHEGTTLTLFIEDDKVVKYTWSIKDTEEVIEDPVFAAVQFFAFTGCGPSHLTASGEYPIAKVYSLIYNIPFAGNECRFISLRTCSCNMGNCGAVLEIISDTPEINTIGDLMAVWGDKSSDNKWFEYPDSVFLYVEKAPKSVRLYSNGCHKESIKTDLVNVFGNGAEFYTWYYSR